jgi:hypothetical protein
METRKVADDTLCARVEACLGDGNVEGRNGTISWLLVRFDVENGESILKAWGGE